MYAFPLVFFFVLNSYPSGLALYYFASNIFTVTQSTIIKKFFINDEKIKADLEKNEADYLSGNKKKSKFRQKLDDALKAQQEKAKDMEEKKKKEPTKADKKRRDIRNKGKKD
jgi:YidC/Oxa1 family membrane protein insertase